MGLERFLDDNNIVKKKSKVVKQEVKQEENEPIESEIEDKIEEPKEKPKKKTRKKKSEAEEYKEKVEQLIKENPQLKPKSEAKLTIDMQVQKPVYVVSKENGKVKVETRGAKEMLTKKHNIITNVKQVLQEKFYDAQEILEEEKVELEILSRMMANAKDNIKPKYEAAMKASQAKINDLSLRVSIIDTLMKE